MKRPVAAIAVLAMVLACCTGSSADDASGTAATVERRPVDSIEELPASSAPQPVCVDSSPIRPEQVGTVNTIVVPANADSFDGSVVAVPDAACPGDVVSFVVSIVNTSEEDQLFSANRGLIFSSGGMAKWSLASLPRLVVTVQPGERLEETVTGTVPTVAPGTYRLSPEGAGFFGEIIVLDPTID